MIFHEEVFEAFASDVLPEVRRMLVENFDIHPNNIFGDIRERIEFPKVHVYTAGPPCQSFSKQGLGKGGNSENGEILLWCAIYIQEAVSSVTREIDVKCWQFAPMFVAKLKLLWDMTWGQANHLRDRKRWQLAVQAQARSACLLECDCLNKGLKGRAALPLHIRCLEQ